MALAEPVSDLYDRAKAAISDNYYDQELEDEIDAWMEAEDRVDEDALIAELVDDVDAIAHDRKVELTPSQFTEFAIRVPVAGRHERFSFEGREYLREPYDTSSPRILMKCARQVEKSTYLGNRSIAFDVTIPNFRVLYVSATAQQAQVFSVDRIKEPIETSEEIRPLIDHYNQNVLFKQFRNRSQIRIRYAFLSADRVRGIPADKILIDEIQDILTENIPVIEQCASHSDYKIFCYSGTPKSRDNTIEIYWSNFSTQNEWMVPCERHGTPKRPDTWHWNMLGTRNIGKKGLICARCGKPINARHPMAQWMPLQAQTADNAARVTFEGYRVPQLMVPWVEWKEILAARERYSTAQFNNEVLGLSYDSGTRPLTRAQVEASCKKGIHFNDVEKNAARCSTGVYVGIDWGTGENTYTVMALGGYMEHGFQIFYLHRFTGEDLEPQRQLTKIAKLITSTGFRLIGADYGGGFDRNDWLMRNFDPTRLVKYMYSARPRKKIYWEPSLGRFVCHRTEVMSDIFNAIKRRLIGLPNWEEFLDPHGNDFLNIFSEYNDQLRMVQYKVSPGKTDDSFHAVLYCLLASMLDKPRPDIIIPIKEGDMDWVNR